MLKLVLEADIGSLTSSFKANDTSVAITSGLKKGITISTDISSYGFSIDIDKISIENETKDSEGNFLYSEFYINTINTAITIGATAATIYFGGAAFGVGVATIGTLATHTESMIERVVQIFNDVLPAVQLVFE